MRADVIDLVVQPGANVVNAIARFFVLQQDLGAAHGYQLVGLCQGIVAQIRTNRTGFGTANATRGGRDTVGRSK